MEKLVIVVSLSVVWCVLFLTFVAFLASKKFYMPNWLFYTVIAFFIISFAIVMLA